MFSSFSKSIFLALMLLNCVSLLADSSQGELLEKQIWEIIKDRQWQKLTDRIAPYFQYASLEEVLNKEQYIDHAKRLSVSDYVLSNFKVTEDSDVKVVTYEIQVSESRDGKSFTSKANRLSVWKKNRDQWQWVSHAVLIPLSSD